MPKKADARKLTKGMVERATNEDGGWFWLPDADVGGFGLRVYASGVKVFFLRYRSESGKQRMLRLGEYGTLTVQKARELAQVEKVKVLQGRDPQAERTEAAREEEREARELATVAELLDAWIDDYAKVHRKRWEEDKHRIDANIRPPLGGTRLEDVDVGTLAAWHRSMKDTPVEANRCLETLRTAWRWAEREERLPDGAPKSAILAGGKDARVKRYREKDRDRWLRKEEVKRLMEATDKEEDPHVRALVPLYLLTGLRKRELLDAKWEHVDLERQEIRLPDTKSGSAQVRLLPDPAVDIFRTLPRFEGNPHVFPSPTVKGAARSDFKRQWKRIRKRAKLTDITLHDLRRTAGSFMAQAGTPLEVIQKVLGHSHPGVTKLYARLASENERDALDTLAAELSGLLGTDTAPSENGADPTPSEPLRERLTALLEASDDGDDLADRLRALAQEVEA